MAFSLCTKCSRRNKSPASSHHRININYFQSFCFNKYSIFPWLWVVCCWVKIIVIFVSRSQLWCLSHKKYRVLIHVSWRGSFLYDLYAEWNLKSTKRLQIKSQGMREYWNWCKSLVSFLPFVVRKLPSAFVLVICSDNTAARSAASAAGRAAVPCILPAAPAPSDLISCRVIFTSLTLFTTLPSCCTGETEYEDGCWTLLLSFVIFTHSVNCWQWQSL